MPELEDVEMLQRFRAGDPDSRVTLVTGHAEEGVQARLRVLPNMTVTSKPFLPKELRHEIRKLMVH